MCALVGAAHRPAAGHGRPDNVWFGGGGGSFCGARVRAGASVLLRRLQGGGGDYL
jgi:hypothetical protein